LYKNQVENEMVMIKRLAMAMRGEGGGTREKRENSGLETGF
jgi:hypothetical protein